MVIKKIIRKGIDYMTNLEYLICEAERCGEIDLSTRNMLLNTYTESVFGMNPLKKFLEKTKEIKDAKPKEYDGPKEIKEFVDKYYDDVKKIAGILEKEPDKIRTTEIKYAVGVSVSFVGGYILCVSSIFAGGGLFIAGFATMVLSMISSIIYSLLSVLRTKNDIKVSDDLAKIRAALKKIKTDKLDKKDKNKISDMITAIDDAETEVSARMKVTKESAIEDMKMSIYEAEMTGDISLEDRNALLKYLEEKAEVAL